LQLHLLAAREEGLGIAQDLRVQRVGNRFAPRRLISHRLVGIDLDEQRIEVEIVEMRGPARDLCEQVGAPDRLVERGQAELGEDAADIPALLSIFP